MKANYRFMAGTMLNEAMRRARSQHEHQRRFANWLLNRAIINTQKAIAEYLESKQPKRPVGQMEMFA